MGFYFAVVLAGGLGALMRVLLHRFTIHMGWTALPFGTLIANVIGSFLIAYLAFQFTQRWQLSDNTQIVILSGLLGGFTTFSAFSFEVIGFLQNGQAGKAIFYALASVLLSLVACCLGFLLAR